jgi:FixJ family two-component response regulator
MPHPSRLISIVDDDLSVCRALRRLVQSAGYTGETFASAGAFLDSSALGRTACLVLDIHLNGVSGFDLQERLMADGAGIPIIFITAHDDVPTRERVRRAGVAAYLPKPFDEQALLDAVRDAVEGGPRSTRALGGGLRPPSEPPPQEGIAPAKPALERRDKGFSPTGSWTRPVG